MHKREVDKCFGEKPERGIDVLGVGEGVLDHDPGRGGLTQRAVLSTGTRRQVRGSVTESRMFQAEGTTLKCSELQCQCSMALRRNKPAFGGPCLGLWLFSEKDGNHGKVLNKGVR